MATYINCITGSADELDDTPTGGYDEEKPTIASGYNNAPTQEESPTSTYCTRMLHHPPLLNLPLMTSTLKQVR